MRQAIVSLAGLVGEPVHNQAGQQVGRLVDVVARLYGEDRDRGDRSGGGDAELLGLLGLA